jgi:hypothetical protein
MLLLPPAPYSTLSLSLSQALQPLLGHFHYNNNPFFLLTLCVLLLCATTKIYSRCCRTWLAGCPWALLMWTASMLHMQLLPLGPFSRLLPFIFPGLFRRFHFRVPGNCCSPCVCCCAMLFQVLPDMSGWVSLGPADVEGQQPHSILRRCLLPLFTFPGLAARRWPYPSAI